MAIENINDGVGKKIVEALKMQSDEATDENMITEDFDTEQEDFGAESVEDKAINASEDDDFLDSSFADTESNFNTPSLNPQTLIDNAFNNSLTRNLGGYESMPDEMEYPANVAVLRQLITKLPTGVSKQTGALIIKQTMEALGISMSSVIQEAKQFQEMLNANSKECQRNIIEYKKQISLLEGKTQQYQRQNALMNDIINLFVHSR